MAQIESWFEQDLKKPVPVRKLEGVFNEDSQANVIGVQLYDDGVALTSISGSVTGYFLLADGTTTSISGTKSGGKASVVIPPAAYKVTGPITITVRITNGSNITTVCACVGLVMLTKTPVATPAGSTIADWSAQISAQLAACQAAADAVGATVAVPFNEAVANDAGTYVTSSGHMYYLPNGHAANVSLANTTKVETNCGNELTSLKNAIVKENVAQVDDKTRTTTGIFIDATTTKWKTSSTATYAIIKVKSGDKVKLVAGSRATYIAILKSYSAPVADTDPDYSDATGFTTLINVTSNSTYSNEMPSDANYFYVFLGTSSIVRTPAVLEINGYDYVQPLFDNYSKIINQINTHFSELDSTYKVSSAAASEYSNLLSHIINVGVYYISNTQPFTDRPQYIRTSNLGMTITVSEYAFTLVKQELITARGLVATRLVNKSNFTPYTTAIGVDGNGWFYNQSMRWTNKKIVCFGDSRTWYDGQTYNSRTKPGISGTACIGYQEQMRILLGAILTNEGVSGDKSTQICNRIRAYDFSEFDAVLLEGGVNDYIKSSSVTIGELQPIGSTFDTTTVYGAWQSAIEYLMTNYPKVKIFITVPAIAWDDDNTMGTVFPYTVASIKKEIAELYMLPVLDLYTTAGITVINRDTFYCDDVSQTGWRLHFNNDGNVLIGQMIAEYIETH